MRGFIATRRRKHKAEADLYWTWLLQDFFLGPIILLILILFGVVAVLRYFHS